MKLENKLFKSFFYPFLICVFLSTFLLIIYTVSFTHIYYDTRMYKRILDLESKYSKLKLKSSNMIITTILHKIQAGLNEQILHYQQIANKIKENDINQLKLYDEFLKCVFDYDEDYLKNNKKNLEYMGFWYINDVIRKFDYIKNNETKKEIISFSNIMQNLYSTSVATSLNNSIYKYYFFFDETDLFISFPISYDYKFDFLDVYERFDHNPYWCANDQGEIFQIYYAKCRDFYINIQKAKSNAYDNNYLNTKNRTIFVTNFYKQLNDDTTEDIFTMCIQFLDPITKGNAYACSDVSQEDLKSSLDDINSGITGYFFISCVGFTNVFFFPNGYEYSKTITENIFRWDVEYESDEKILFFQYTQKLLTSNYINQLNYEIDDEVFVNGENSSEQYFYLNNKKLKFSIYPITLINLNGEKEHTLSIIYIYNNELYMSKYTSYDSSLIVKIILELIICIILGWGLLHIIILTFNIQAKYIVIPTKVANFMLKGINIGGNNRLNYLNFLKKKQNDNLEKLEKMYSFEEKQKNNDISEIIDNKEGEDLSKDLSINYNNKELKNDDFNKIYDEESEFIEKELNFYDFDESLLQYRPYEIDNLINLLIDLKGSLILTSSDRSAEEIINYSYSEGIFKKFKNIEGSSICQSNIGNLQIQLMKFDKAIYHLAISLQDNKLKKFLSRNLTDELDESDCLLNNISNSFNRIKNKEKNNILMTKQQNNMHDNFSQKIIGNLINTRYCRLIYSYYKFFAGMKKLQKINGIKVKGQFMNTYFHTMNYFHKIIIQFIYFSYIKNDLIKIGEGILDYIEFMIKFKLKTSKDKKIILKIENKDYKEYYEKQKYKKNNFDKIIKWFNLFDDYITYIKDNTSLSDDKNIIKEYIQNFENKDNLEANSTYQTVFFFRVNIQRKDFLKGKFALCCQNYNDALFYFIRASKKNCIVMDGLIKKRSLEKIYKILTIFEKNCEKYKLLNVTLKDILSPKKTKIKHKTSKIVKKNSLTDEKDKTNKNNTFYEEIKIIKKDIIKDINECKSKQTKDVIILIDYNIYIKLENNKDIINVFIIRTNIILNDYLTLNDRFSVFIYKKQYQIICPLIHKYQIDIQSFSKDLENYKTKNNEENLEQDEYNINLNESQTKNIEIISAENEMSENSNEEESIEDNYKTENLNKKLESLLIAINSTKNYLKMKERIESEKYIILFTDLFSAGFIVDEKVEKIVNKVKGSKAIIFLLIGKFKDSKNNHTLKLIISKFSEKSEIINFDNMEKIKTILSFNNVINDEIIYPNEIYK